MKNKIKVIKLFSIILLFTLSLFIGSKVSYAVYRQTLSATINLTILDPSTTYTVTFNPGDGSTPTPSATIIGTYGDELGSLPTSTLAGYNFAGWYTDTTYTTKVNSKDLITGNVTYYAKWVKIICKKATAQTLHQETCRYDSNQGCRAAGKSGQTLTYGNEPGVNTYEAGDAYNCDVNNDGVFDPAEERFYFIRQNNDNNSMVLYYYTSIDANGIVDTQEVVSNDPVTYYEPGSYYYNTALTYAPLLVEDQNSPLPVWDNPGLIKFDNIPARLINLDDVEAACGTLVVGTSGYLDSCEFLMENSRYQDNLKGRAGIWVLKPSTTSATEGYRLHTGTRTLGEVNITSTSTGSNNTYRPAIEIPIDAIEGYQDKTLYTITFDSDGGSSITPVQRYENQEIGELDEPTKTGYVFEGWYFDSNHTNEVTPSSLMPANNITVHALWAQITDNMEYVFRVDGTCVFNGKPDLQNNNPNYITSPNDSCIGIDKDGVSTNYTSAGNERNYIDTGIALFSEENAGKEFELGFTIDSYNYAGQDSNQATFMNSKLENSTLYYPGFVVRRNTQNTQKIQLSERFNSYQESYEFNYTAGMRIRVVRKDNKMYYAKDDDELTELQDISAFNQYFNLHAWFGAISLETDPESDGVGSSADRYIKATLSNMYIKLETEQPANTHRVEFITEGGTLNMNSARYVADGGIVGPLPTVTRNHYTFDGWYTQNGVTPITSNYVINEDTNFYAHFTPDSHTVTFNNDGGNPASYTMTVDFNEALGTLPNAPTKDHYTFGGWYTDTNWDEMVTIQTIVTGDVTYVAKWIPDSHTITFDVEGGTPQPSSYSRNYGEAIGPLPTNVTKTDYTFIGWYKDTTWAEQVFDDTPVWGNATLHAKWGLGFPVTFNTQGGSYIAPIVVNYGDPLGQIEEPTKTYFVFDGWYLDSDLTMPADENTLIYQATILYAAWALDPIYVAQIGNDYYETLSSALGAVTTNTQTTIKILKDISLTSLNTISSTQNIILDLNGKTISNNTGTVIQNEGTLTINDTSSGGTLTGGRQVSGKQVPVLVNKTGGTVIINDGTISSDASQVVDNNGSMTIHGGLITIGNVVQGVLNNNAGGTLTMDGGQIVASVAGSKRQAIYNKGTVNLYDGAVLISASTDRAALQNDAAGAVINIYGGEISSTNEVCQRGAVQNCSGATLNVYGGTITSSSNNTSSSYHPGGIQNDGTLKIGTKDNLYDTTSPVIIGNRHGVYSSKNFELYDGIIKGKVAAVNDMSKIPSANTEPNTNPVTTGTEIIGSDTYYLLYYELTNGFTITFNADGGNVSPQYKTVPENTAIGSLPDPDKTGYVFDGWYNENNQLVNENTIVTKDEVYTAHWVQSVLQANIANDEVTLNVNDTSTINVTNSSNIETYTYSSNNPGIATVNSSGVITAVAPGITQISLTGDRSGDIKRVIVTSNVSNSIETFDILPEPMRVYFNNIDIWAKEQTDTSHASYDTYMNANLSAFNCINFGGDSRQTKSSSTGSVYCDLPNQYDTGLSGNINVYEYNYTTNTLIGDATYVTVNNGKLYNMIPGKAYYYESASDSTQNGKFYAFGERRVISIDNLKYGSNDTYFQTRNVRDLGGIPVTYENASNQTVNGTIKFGKLYRGEKIWGGSPDALSLQYFDKLGINHEMDLRANSEPIASEEDSFGDAYKIRSASKTYEIIHYGIDYDSNRSNYDLARAAVVEVMNAFINDPNYSLYFHCRIGADRTGTLAYLLEGLLGVSEEDRYRDYELTVFFGLDERTRFYTNKDSNYVKFVYMKQAIRNASQNDTEDVVAWFLKGSSDTTADMTLIQNFRSALVE